MSEQLLVIGLGIADDADAAWLLGGLALDEPPVIAYGVTATTGYVISSTSVVAGSTSSTSVTAHQTATVTTQGSQ